MRRIGHQCCSKIQEKARQEGGDLIVGEQDVSPDRSTVPNAPHDALPSDLRKNIDEFDRYLQTVRMTYVRPNVRLDLSSRTDHVLGRIWDRIALTKSTG